MNATERARHGERRRLLHRSEDQGHADCADCTAHGRNTLTTIHLGPTDWQRSAASWHRHLALD